MVGVVVGVVVAVVVGVAVAVVVGVVVAVDVAVVVGSEMMKAHWWLSDAELNYWLVTAETIKYTTVRGAYKMAPLTLDELAHSPNVMLFLGKREPYACFIIRYGVGAFKTLHRDPPNRAGQAKHRHERMICLLQNADDGGQLTVGGTEELFLPRDAILFRADLEEHGVSEVKAGERIILTVGKLVPT